jgi:hypothetical protein
MAVRTAKPPRPIFGDAIVKVNKLRVTREGHVHVREAMLGTSDDARVGLASIIGMRLDATNPKALSAAHAHAVNEKLARVPKTVLVRVAWKWTAAERAFSLCESAAVEPEGIVLGIEVVAASGAAVTASAFSG